MDLLSEFRKIRRVSTPWVAIRTTDFRLTAQSLLKSESLLNSKGEPRDEPKLIPAAIWDCVSGPVSPMSLNTGETISATVSKEDLGSFDDAPFVILKNATERLPEDAILFMVVTDQSLLDNPFTMQAIANLREPFKATGRTLVLLGPSFKLPALIAEDMPVIDDPLPTVEELQKIAEGIVGIKNRALAEAKRPKLAITPEEISRAANICLGMTRFAAEEGVSRNLPDSGKPDFDGLRDLQRSTIESVTDKALQFETEKWTYKDMGGAETFIGFMRALYKGPRQFRLVVRVDEIDKDITSASTGAVADNTGISQYLLKAFLTTIEDNKHLAALIVGPPGTGKTLTTISTANEFGCRGLSFDMGACKESLAGASEAKMRRVMQTVLAMGGKDVLWLATCNRVDTLPPELQARFWLGTWFFDLPSRAEKDTIWDIQRKAYKIKADDPRPEDESWVGRDIRNCCRMAFMTDSSLKDAAKWITITGVVNKKEIQRCREQAEDKAYRSAATPGPYKMLDRGSLAGTRKLNKG